MLYFTKYKVHVIGANMGAMNNLAERLRNNPPVKQFRIGEVIRFSGLSRQTVHNYTIMGLISETERTEGGHRLYSESVFHILARIEELKKTKTLREIRLVLDRERFFRGSEE
jgi:MerR-like DNA binding protein